MQEPGSRGTHLAVMLGHPEHAPIWKESLVRALEAWSVVFEPPVEDGSSIVHVNTSRDLYGFAWLLDRDEAGERHPAAPFLDYRSSCPFLADLEPIGFVEWIELEGGYRSDWLVPLIKEGKGLIVGLETRCVRAAVIERSFSLENLESKFGFEDGAVLLTRDMDALNGYRWRTADAIERSLAEQGIELHVYGPESTIHNTFRIGSPLRTNGKVIEDRTEITRMLAGLTTTIWVYDFDLGRDEALFG